MRAQQHTSGFSASFWLYVQKSDLLIRFSSGFAAYEPFGKPGSLSDPHRLREEKPDAGLDFHLPAQQTDPEGGKRKACFPSDQKPPASQCGSLACSPSHQAEEEEGGALTFTGWPVDGLIPSRSMSTGACHKKVQLLETVPKQLDDGKIKSRVPFQAVRPGIAVTYLSLF